MNSGHEERRPRQESGARNSFSSRMPHTGPFRPLPRQHLDDINAAIQCGMDIRVVEEVEARAEARAREILLEQAGEWRSWTSSLAADKGPAWREAMLAIVDGDDEVTS